VLEFFEELGVQLIHCYGQAETCGLVTWTLHAGAAANGVDKKQSAQSASTKADDEGRERLLGLVSVGEALPECEFKLAGDGEILVRGPHLFTGYYQVPLRPPAAWSLRGFCAH
jgi:long-subunit acyl-CoA synthetase (AMP-forming)